GVDERIRPAAKRQRPPVLGRTRCEPLHCLLEHRPRRQALRSNRQLPLIEPRDEEEVLREPDETVGVLRRRLQRLLQLLARARVTEGELELRLPQRQRPPPPL